LRSHGRVVFRTGDDHGPIVVRENGDRLILTFGNDIGQSSVSITHPQRLEYAYLQGMFLAALLAPERRTALVLGMGGGSLVRALTAGFPDCRITAVEGRAQVVRVAREWFFLPDNGKISVVVADAVDYLAKAETQYDLIFADLYRAEGVDARQTEPAFLNHCRAALKPGGVLAANFWTRDIEAVQQTHRNLAGVFGERLLQLPVRGGNLITYACADSMPTLGRKAFYRKAEELGSRLDTPLGKLAHHFWRQNAEALQVGRYRR
jgi:spermidine synthase